MAKPGTPEQFPEAMAPNVVFKASLPNARDLHTHTFIDPDTNMPVAMSVWEVDEDEIMEIKRTGRVFLFVIGESHPHVYITGTAPSVIPDVPIGGKADA